MSGYEYLSIDPVGFRASNPMMFNRYLYVNDNPNKYHDPDGRELIPFSTKRPGSAAHRSEINAINSSLRSARRSNSETRSMIKQLENSDNKHIIMKAADGDGQKTSNTAFKGSGNKESNGVGTGTVTVVDVKTTTSHTNPDGTTIQMSGTSKMVHELSHAADKDLGVIDRSETDGVPNHEQKAVDDANTYRESVGEDTRDSVESFNGDG